MLFGTYQKIFDYAEQLPENLLNPKRRYNKKLGFSPLWAFPVDDIPSFAAHSICTAPNFADVFYLIETDDFVRINKVLHYKMIADGGYKGKDPEDIDYSEVVDEQADNDHSEILIDPDRIHFENIRCMSLVSDAKENAFQQIHLTTPPLFRDPEAMKEIAHVIDYFAKDVPQLDIEAFTKRIIEEGYHPDYAKIEGRQRSLKFIFEMTMIPYIFTGYSGRETEIKTYQLGALSHNARKFLLIGNKFKDWAENSCDKEGYDRIFYELKNLAITSEGLLKCAAEKRKIYPNEPCPCGSGKKYKNCHAKFM